eukprot:5244564-Karenia_brevis.AAC.1
MDDLSVLCSTCQRPQPRRHFCDPLLKQSKDPDYTDAVYKCVLCPGRWRTCKDSEKRQELFPCKMCGKMLPEAKYTYCITMAQSCSTKS